MKLLIFKQYQVDVKDMKCPFWQCELMFSIVDFLVHQMLGIVVSQIKDDVIELWNRKK
jgi:succinate dehydrogenase hydrophobic anchor subunit